MQDEAAGSFAHLVATVHSSLRHIRAASDLLEDIESVEATAEELDWELKTMLEGFEQRLPGMERAVAEE